MGYSVEAGIFSAAECGAPHRRERLFILANAGCSQQGRISRNSKKKNDFAQKGQKANGRDPQSSPSSQLGNTRSSEPRRLSGSQRQEDSTIRSASQLADTESGGPRRQVSERESVRKETPGGRFSDRCNWPSRPGQPQYEWEEPRVVGNARRITKRSREETRIYAGGQADKLRQTRTDNACEPTESRNEQAQSRLGRAVDGTRSRLDTNKGISNETMSSMPETNNKQRLEKGKILQPSLLLGKPQSRKPEQGNTPKASTKKVQSKPLSAMQFTDQCPETSSQSKQRCSNDNLPEVPHKDSCEGWDVGQQEKNSMRVDRLRLLGNGVVPAQAERAFRYLMGLFKYETVQ